MVDVKTGIVLTDSERMNLVKNARAFDIKDDTYGKKFISYNPGQAQLEIHDPTWQIKAKALQNITGGVAGLKRYSSTQKQGKM